MTLSLDQIEAAIVAANRVQRMAAEAKTLILVGMEQRAELRLASALSAFEGLAAALCIDLPETDAARSADMAEA